MIQDEWRELLEKSSGAEDNWLAWLHRGVMNYYRDDRAQAWLDWQHSLQLQKTPWALRNLAVLDAENGQLDEAAGLYLSAFRLLPTLLPLTIETGQMLLMAGRTQDWLDLVSRLSPRQRQYGRIKLLEARAALALEDFDRVTAILDKAPTVDTLREGEQSLADLWYDYQAARLSRAENIPADDALRQRVRREFPLPAKLNFQMSAEI
jgi:tetratricopeptide (TPR) repeat protein